MSGILERFVTALEGIAQGIVNIGSMSGAPTTVGTGEQSSAPALNDYAAIGDSESGRDKLLAICKERGITIAPRTGIPKIIEHLQTWDKAHAGGGTSEPDPFSTGSSAPDPFGEAVKLTIEEVRNVLQKVHEQLGVTEVIRILKEKGGGIEKLQQLEEANFKAVHDESNTVLANIK